MEEDLVGPLWIHSSGDRLVLPLRSPLCGAAQARIRLRWSENICKQKYFYSHLKYITPRCCSQPHPPRPTSPTLQLPPPHPTAPWPSWSRTPSLPPSLSCTSAGSALDEEEPLRSPGDLALEAYYLLQCLFLLLLPLPPTNGSHLLIFGCEGRTSPGGKAGVPESPRSGLGWGSLSSDPWPPHRSRFLGLAAGGGAALGPIL